VCCGLRGVCCGLRGVCCVLRGVLCCGMSHLPSPMIIAPHDGGSVEVSVERSVERSVGASPLPSAASAAGFCAWCRRSQPICTSPPPPAPTRAIAFPAHAGGAVQSSPLPPSGWVACGVWGWVSGVFVARGGGWRVACGGGCVACGGWSVGAGGWVSEWVSVVCGLSACRTVVIAANLSG
jgi:hypothetical protein